MNRPYLGSKLVLLYSKKGLGLHLKKWKQNIQLCFQSCLSGFGVTKNDALGTGDTLSEIFQQEEDIYVEVHRLHNACHPLNISGVHKMNRARSTDT